MRFDGVDGDERDPVLVFPAELFRGRDPLLKGRSGEGAEYHHDGFFREQA